MANNDFPTEVIDLPSKGKLYPESNPLSKGTVEIKYMTAREEDILASQNLIRKGVVLDKLFESVVVEKDVNVGDIFIGDKNAILLATRILGYGKDYQVEVTDPFSGEIQKTNIDLSKVQVKEVDTDFLNKYNEMVLIPEKFFLFVRRTKDGKNVIEEKMLDYFGTVVPQNRPILKYKLTDLDDFYIDLEWEDFDHSKDIY